MPTQFSGQPSVRQGYELPNSVARLFGQ